MAKPRHLEEDQLPEGLAYERPQVPPRESPTQIEVLAHYRESGEIIKDSAREELEVIRVERFEVEPAEIGLELSRTINLGDYNSIRAAVTVKVPCYKEEIDKAYTFAEKFAKNRLLKEIEGIVQWANDNGVKNNLF